MAEGREFVEPALRDMHRLMTKLFYRQMAEMNKDILRVITGGPALHKSVCLEEGEPVLKARADPLSAGSRGGKWYRDSHNKIRYGEKPSAQIKTKIPDAASAQLEANFQLAMSVGDMRCLLNFIAANDVQLTSNDAMTIANLGATARTSGSSMKDTFANYLTDVEVGEYDENGDLIDGSAEAPSEDDIAYLWNRYVDGWEALSKTDGFATAMTTATQRITEKSAKITTKLGELTDTIHALATDVLREKPPVVALKFLAAMLLHDWAYVGTEAEEKSGHRKVDDSELGRLVISDKGVMEGILHTDDLSASQVLLLVLAAKQHLASMELRLASVGSDDLAFSFQWFGNHFDLTDTFFAAYEKEHERFLTDGEKDKYCECFGHLCKTFFELLDDANRGRDGQSIAKVLHGWVPADKILSDAMAATDIISAFTEFQALRAAALKAQEADEWDASPRMKTRVSPQTLNWMQTVRRGIDITADHNAVVAFTDMLIEQQLEPRAIILAPIASLPHWQATIDRLRPGSRVLVIEPHKSRAQKIKALKTAESTKAEFVLMSHEDAEEYSDATLDKTRKPTHLRDADGVLVRDENGDPVEHPEKKGPVDLNKLARLHAQDDLQGAITLLRGVLFVDDAHNSIKGRGTGSVAIQQHLGQRTFAFLLSATPMRHGPVGMYDMLSVVRPDATGPSKAQWLSRMLVHTIDPSTGKLAPTSVGRISELTEDLAPFVYGNAEIASVILIGFDDEKHEQMFDKLLHEAIEEAKPVLKGKAETVEYLLLFEKLGELQQVMLTPALLKPNWKKRSPALQAAVETIMTHCEEAPEKPVVVFSGEPKVFELLSQELVKEGVQLGQIASVTSETPIEQRNAVQDAANIQKLSVVMVALGAGGAGFNLQRSGGLMLFLDRGTSPLDVAEAVGRLQPAGALGSKAAQQAVRVDFAYPHAGSDIVMQLTVQAVANLLKALAEGKVTPEEFTNLRATFKETFGTDMPTAAKIRREFDMNAVAPANFPKAMQKEHFKPKKLRPLQPEPEYLPAEESPYQDGGDLEVFYQMVLTSNATTARDLATGYLREEVGEEDWNRAPVPGEGTTPEKAMAFAKEVFRKLLETGGIYERVPDPSVSPLSARGLEPEEPEEEGAPKDDSDAPAPAKGGE